MVLLLSQTSSALLSSSYRSIPLGHYRAPRISGLRIRTKKPHGILVLISRFLGHWSCQRSSGGYWRLFLAFVVFSKCFEAFSKKTAQGFLICYEQVFKASTFPSKIVRASSLWYLRRWLLRASNYADEVCLLFFQARVPQKQQSFSKFCCWWLQRPLLTAFHIVLFVTYSLPISWSIQLGHAKLSAYILGFSWAGSCHQCKQKPKILQKKHVRGCFF